MAGVNGFVRVFVTTLWAAVLVGGLDASAAPADNWPSRPVRLIVPYAAGGSTDIVGRAFSQYMTEALGKSMVVENRGGAAGSLAAAQYSKSALDDHALLMVTVGQMSINQFIYKAPGYDPEVDLQTIGLVGHTANVLVVQPSSPIRSMKELIDYAKANPDKLNYSSAGVGSTGHLLNELIKTRMGIQMAHVPYKGNGPAMQALLAGEVQFNTDNMPQLVSRVLSGQLRALAVSSEQRWFQLPAIPTFAELGYPELTTMVWFGVVAHSRMPKAIIERMNREMTAVLKRPEVVARFKEFSMETITSTPEEMLALARKERERWRKVVVASGATAD